jgi:alcohol dehydrogenase class IV
MLAAASMGAAAFQKGLGAVHAIAHPVGSWFDTHHGLTNAIVLPYVMRHNRPAIAAKIELIARLLGLPSPGFEALFDWVLELRRTLGIAHSLAEIGVDVGKASVIGEQAARDPSAAGNPAPLDPATLERIFRAAVAGDLKAVG